MPILRSIQYVTFKYGDFQKGHYWIYIIYVCIRLALTTNLKIEMISLTISTNHATSIKLLLYLIPPGYNVW